MQLPRNRGDLAFFTWGKIGLQLAAPLRERFYFRQFDHVSDVVWDNISTNLNLPFTHQILR